MSAMDKEEKKYDTNQNHSAKSFLDKGRRASAQVP